ncbi:MAG: asparaginase [Streptomycetales bacterium]
MSLGGTIAMADDGSGRVVPALSAGAIVASVPALAGVATLEAVSFRQLPGAHLGLDDLIALAAEIERRLDRGTTGVVVTQGTDSLEESAYVLDCLLGRDESVILTGAMRHPEAAGADGPANVLAAVQTAASPEARGAGVLVLMNDEVHASRFVRKGHTTSPSAFQSPVSGPIGWVSEGRPRVVLRPARLPPIRVSPEGGDRSVALVTVGLGDDGRLVRAAGDLGYAGMVVEATGAGHVPPEVADALADAASRLPVVLTSRTGCGEVLRATYGFAGSERDLLDRGLIPAGHLDGLKARLLLALLLRGDATYGEIEEAFERRGTC